MRKIIILSISLIGIITAILYLTNLLPKPTTYDDCMEFGICAEGLALKDNGKSYVMTKEYCINSKHIWYEDSRTCNVRKVSD